MGVDKKRRLPFGIVQGSSVEEALLAESLHASVVVVRGCQKRAAGLVDWLIHFEDTERGQTPSSLFVSLLAVCRPGRRGAAGTIVGDSKPPCTAELQNFDHELDF